MKKETKEQRLQRLYPWIKWTEPVPIKLIGRFEGFGCRFCIAMIGYKPAENQMPGFNIELEEVVKHIKQQHQEEA